MSVLATLLFVSAVTAHPFIPQNDFDRERKGMTWSNFMPGGGMTMWSTANDDFWAPEPDRRLLPPPQADDAIWPSEAREHQDKKDEGKGVKEEVPSSHDSPPAPARPFDDDRERRPLKPSHQRPAKKGYRDQDDDDDRRYSGSNASVNAWFPIMFGVLPQDAKTKQSDDGSAASGNPNSDPYDHPRTITAVANSVNHATRGLANAHTVLYAGEPPASFRRMARSLFVVQ